MLSNSKDSGQSAGFRELSREQLIVRLEEERMAVERLRAELKQVKACKMDDNTKEAGRCDRCGLSEQEWQANLRALDEWQSKCKAAENERDQLREELRSMEREMEELHDNFKEEESEQFEQVKQELDLAVKNCKILQIRLNKSERQFGQLEQVKTMLESQLAEATNGNPKYQNNQQQQQQQQQHGQDPLIDTTNVSSYAQVGPNLVRLSNEEYDQLLHDLSDTNERARDLQEQVKYTLEEARLKDDKLQAVEAENELLLSKLQKLTASNARLRAASSIRASQSGSPNPESCQEKQESQMDELRQLIEQNEQLKLALEVAQADCQRQQAKLQQVNEEHEIKQEAAERRQTDGQAARFNALKRQLSADNEQTSGDQNSRSQQVWHKLELENRQLRTKLVHSERECKQMKAQLELVGSTGDKVGLTSQNQSNLRLVSEQARYKEMVRQLQEQCSSLVRQNSELERRVEQLSSEKNVGNTELESTLLGKLKRQLEASEQELAKAKSRLVELDADYGRVQREHKRLVESLEGRCNENQLARRAKLANEAQWDSMSRQELRQALKELAGELDETVNVIRSRELLATTGGSSKSDTTGDTGAKLEDEVKNLRRLLEEERITNGNLKQLEAVKVKEWERSRSELESKVRMFERERVAMEEELDKLRQVNTELNGQLDEAKRNQRSLNMRLKEAQFSGDKLRNLASGSVQTRIEESTTTVKSSASDLLLMARDLSELKAKNAFLMRQLELAREENARQVDEWRQVSEGQQRRAVEMAQLELKERQLADTQQLRDEINELKQRLAANQRQVNRAEEEASGERDRVRTMERDWRRDKSQWQQRLEQLEAQLAIEQRSSEFRLKEAACSLRDKERELISIQDRCVQVERDLQRAQNKQKLFEENSESKQKQLERELEAKKRELSELIGQSGAREQEYYDNCKRFNGEKATLVEALESLRRSHEDKVAELKSARVLLMLRQEQAYKERQAAMDKIDSLSGQLLRATEQETQANLLRQRLEAQERQVDVLKRETGQLKEEKQKLRNKCDELERRCQSYEKQELINKTSSISTSAFLKAKNHFSFGKHQQATGTGAGAGSNNIRSPSGSHLQNKENYDPEQFEGTTKEDLRGQQSLMVERLSSKIKDQRQLMNMLKQQHDELQMELKQSKLVLEAERNKWQCRVSQLSGQLNEAEEKLLFESSHQLGKDTLEVAQRRLEAKWAAERRATLEALQQQQAQNELLVRDLKKLSQAHDLLRLQAKQLESNNHKLSRRLIEFEGQQARLQVGVQKDGKGNSDLLEQQLATCQAERASLAQECDRLVRLRANLERLLLDQVQPMVDQVAKLLSATDSTGESDEQRPIRTSSSSRPLMISASSAASDHAAGSGGSSHSAHQVTGGQSRLGRFLGKQSKLPDSANSEAQIVANNPTTNSKGKIVRRTKLRKSSLGLSVAERKELKRRLTELRSSIAEFSGDSRLAYEQPQRVANSGGHQLIGPRASSERPAGSESPSVSSRVHWRLESANSADSERSWSLSQLNDQPARGDAYKRFPHASPASALPNSLTDYESESSLASDISVSYSTSAGVLSRRGRMSSGGAESDSGLQSGTTSSSRAAGRKRSGLKSRLTSTLRNISRSITGLTGASDSEEFDIGSRGVPKGGDRGDDDEHDDKLREIRV